MSLDQPNASTITRTLSGPADAILERTITPLNVLPVSTYSVLSSKRDECELLYKPSDAENEARIIYRSHRLKAVNNGLSYTMEGKGQPVTYQVQLENVITTTDKSTGEVLAVEPIVMNLTVRHRYTKNVPAEMVSTLFTQLCGALMKSDGTWRFSDLMKSAERPTEE